MRVVVVDDEPLARSSMVRRLGGLEEVEVVGEAADAAEAMEALELLTPDAVFLDILMPGDSGLELARAVAPQIAIVFVTAHEDFAVEAFELDAVDYLTKPVRPARLHQAIARVRRELVRRQAGDSRKPSDRPQDVLMDGAGHISQFVVRLNQRIVLIPIDALLWAEAASNYVRLHTATGSHLIRATVSDLEATLDPARFRRIHRSTIVSLAEVEEIRSDGHGAYQVRLHCGSALRMTRTYRKNLVP